jgi:hypothetical protein
MMGSHEHGNEKEVLGRTARRESYFMSGRLPPISSSGRQASCGSQIAYFPFIRHRPHRKRRVKQFLYFRLCIRCRGNIFTEPLPRNDGGYTYRHTDR